MAISTIKTHEINTMAVRVGLCMIVKNEADVIRRCLASVRPWISHWTIVDTGSTDGTQALIRQAMKGLDGTLYEKPWKNFGHNRTEALQLARPHADYLLVIDADEVFQVRKGFSWPEMHADAYSVLIEHGETLRYQRTCLFSTRKPWCYKGVLHEYPDMGEPCIPQVMDGLSVLYTTQGARSKNPNKFRDDAKVFEQALRDEPQNERYWFYLAQSWRDCGELEQAIRCYQHRAQMPGWDEETWYACYQVARLMEQAGYEESLVLNAYLRAYELRPQRAESLVWLLAYLRSKQRWRLAALFLEPLLKIATTDDRLFVEQDCYQWRRADELALVFFYTDNKPKAKLLWQRLLQLYQTPQSEIQRIKNNIGYC